MPKQVRFPDTFLDYIPEPRCGHTEYQCKLEKSFSRNVALVPPIHALLKVTDRCPSGCSYCAHAGRNDISSDSDTPTLKGTLQQIAEAGCVSVNFTGGEPLVRGDLADLGRHARELGLYSILLTNGSLISHCLKEITEGGFQLVIVSLDSLDPEKYRSTRGVPLAPVLHGIDLLRQVGPVSPQISITSVVTRSNVDELSSLVEYFSQRGIGVQFTPYHHNGKSKDDRLSPRDPERYRSAIVDLKRLKASGSGVLNSEAYLDHFCNFNFDRRSLPAEYRCYSSYTTLYIDAQRNVRACWSGGMPVVGNLRSQSLKDITAGPQMRAARRRVRDLRCEGCWLLCTAEISLRWQ
jgi:MoaA/NifB/PqqE/SkfB family radical SAM enzyme